MTDPEQLLEEAEKYSRARRMAGGTTVAHINRADTLIPELAEALRRAITK